MDHEFRMRARHWAMLSTLIITVASIATFSVVKGLKNDPQPRVIGEYEAYGTKTKVVQAGDCQMFITDFSSNTKVEGLPPQVRMFFSCDKK